jgi:hypothetical protein
MDKDYKFKVGQHVKLKKNDDDQVLYGKVIKSVTDHPYFIDQIIVKWSGIKNYSIYFQKDYDKIELHVVFKKHR